MSDRSANLQLPYMAAAQAQKHVTHNEALELLDVFAQLAVVAFDATIPPLTADDGAVWALGVGPVNDWAGHDRALAIWSNGGWLFATPRTGWSAVMGTEIRIWNGAEWVAPDLPDLANLPGVGINTTYDGTNRLAVASDATLLSNAGAGHQVKINKAAVADTASVLFQTDWSGRAELGLAGTDDFALKVSGDGTNWATALTVLGTSGHVKFGAAAEAPPGSAAAPSLTFTGDTDTGFFRNAADQIGAATGGVVRWLLSSSGLVVNAPITGTAITQSASDTTSGRLLKVGDGGILGGAPLFNASTNLDDIQTPGFHTLGGSYTNGPLGAAANNYPATLQVVRRLYSGGAFITQTISIAGSTARQWVRIGSGGVPVFTPWQVIYNSGSILGVVSQTAGAPTGAVIERGSNVNGSYLRLADGTQMCWQTATASSGAATNWTYPATFSAVPRVLGTVIAPVLAAFCLDSVPTTGVASFSVRDKTDARRADPVQFMAVGHWF